MKYAIVVAGGKGTRMASALPKQFIPLRDGRPVLMHTLEVFRNYDAQIVLILMLPEAQISFWKSLCRQHAFDIPHRILPGGETRFHSVRNGVVSISGGGLVAVHDGVRPFVSTEVIARCFQAAETTKAAIPVIGVTETIRNLNGVGSVTVDRNAYRLVQTPQIFDAELLKQAYEQPYNESFTDDALVVEAYGAAVTLVEGNRENIKITTPFDLKIADALLNA